MKEDLESTFSPDQPAEVGDIKWASIGLGFRRESMINSQDEQWAREKELHDKLRRAGLKLTLGEDGEGVLLLIFERAGGEFAIVLRLSLINPISTGYCKASCCRLQLYLTDLPQGWTRVPPT